MKLVKMKHIQIIYYTSSVDWLEFRLLVCLLDVLKGRLISKAL